METRVSHLPQGGDVEEQQRQSVCGRRAHQHTEGMHKIVICSKK